MAPTTNSQRWTGSKANPMRDRTITRLACLKAAAKPERLRQRRSSAQVLRGRVDHVRTGGVEGAMRQMRESGRFRL